MNHQIIYHVFKESNTGVLEIDVSTWVLMACAIVMSGNIDDTIVDAAAIEITNGATFVDAVSNYVEDMLMVISDKEDIDFLRAYGFCVNEKVHRIQLRATSSTYNKELRVAVSHRMIRSDKIKAAMDIKLTHG